MDLGINTIFFSFDILEKHLVPGQWGDDKFWLLMSSVLLVVFIIQIVRMFYTKLFEKAKQLNAYNDLLVNNQKVIEEKYRVIHQQNEVLIQKTSESENRRLSLENYLNEVLNMSRMEELHSGNLKYTHRVLRKVLLKNLDVDRISFWKFDEEGRKIEMTGIELKNNDSRAKVVKSIYHQDAPAYFEYIESGTVLAIDDINEFDRNTYPEELKSYFKSHDFRAMLDCPFFLEGEIAGLISCESFHVRKWKNEDIVFVRAIAGILSLSYKSHQRKIYQKELKVKQAHIEELNAQLHERVEERTAEINIKNQQLINYAYINSHEIRGPICRLLGLKNLMKVSESSSEILIIKDYMSKSIDELNDITIRAGKILEENMN
ncbi:MAG: GAF domain-containing protein [Cyclobacteriaceae bacterium]